MKVVLKTTVLDRIIEDIEKAKRAGRLVDYVLVTPEESAQLRYDLRADRFIESALLRYVAGPKSSVQDQSTFKCWDFAYQGTTPELHGRRVRVTSSDTICGYPLLVVPAEYHPK